MGKIRNLAFLALVLAACSIPFSYTVDALPYLEREGTFQVGQGGINPNPKTLGPVEITWNPDSRVNLTGASLAYKVCFASKTPGATFAGTLSYTAYLGGSAGDLFKEANRLAQGSKDVSPLNQDQVCLEGQGNLTPGQLTAIQSGTFYVGAQISGDATSSQEATIGYRLELFRIHLSGSLRP
ncbi:hypothetical protein [Thermus altitudinis]|uniref:hypothetical protein n=1 Tax=Thermus altitudinis TaxID=2908145 RepID=UPI001FA9AA4A|nr:hypothetical protein [Thermus altitudinis]